MKARIYGIVGSLALLASFASACRKDPTASGVGAPTEVILDFSALRLSQGDSATIQAKIVDNRLTPLEGDITFSSCDGATASVTPDGSFDPQPPLAKQATVKGLGANATCVIASAAGAKPDTVSVVVLPTSIALTASSTTLVVGDTLVLTAAGALQFSASAGVTLGGNPATVISQTATVLTVQVQMPDVAVAGSTITVTGVNVTYVPGLTVDLPTAGTFTLTSAFDPNSLPDPAATLPIPTAGNSVVLFDGFATGEADNFYSFTLAATTTFTVSVGWGTAADIDILWCDAGCNNLVGNFDGAGSSNPESSTVTLPAGTYNLWLNVFAEAGDPAHLITITVSNP